MKILNLLEPLVLRDPNPWRKDSFPKIIAFFKSVESNPNGSLLNCRLSYFKIIARLSDEATYAMD